MALPMNSLTGKPESELISGAHNGDTEAMDELFRRHYSRSVTVARRILPAQEDFLDAVQSAYLSALQNFQSFRAESSFKTWITRIVLNQCLSQLRKPGRRRVTLSLDQCGPSSLPIIVVDSLTPEKLALRAEIKRALADAAAKLPKSLSEVFTRCTLAGLSIAVTTTALGLTVQATKTRLCRARSLVRRNFRQSSRDKLRALDRRPLCAHEDCRHVGSGGETRVV
jgi:RNA polymerase sigma-70 factor, ECF subfamily